MTSTVPPRTKFASWSLRRIVRHSLSKTITIEAFPPKSQLRSIRRRGHVAASAVNGVPATAVFSRFGALALSELRADVREKVVGFVHVRSKRVASAEGCDFGWSARVGRRTQIHAAPSAVRLDVKGRIVCELAAASFRQAFQPGSSLTNGAQHRQLLRGRRAAQGIRADAARSLRPREPEAPRLPGRR